MSGWMHAKYYKYLFIHRVYLALPYLVFCPAAVGKQQDSNIEEEFDCPCNKHVCVSISWMGEQVRAVPNEWPYAGTEIIIQYYGFLRKNKVNSGGQQFCQYQQYKQPHLTSKHWIYKETTRYDVGNLFTGRNMWLG